MLARVVLDVVWRVVLHRDREQLEATRCVLPIGFDEVGHLLDAGGAAGRPENDVDDLAAQGLRARPFALERDEGDLRRRRPRPEHVSGDYRQGHAGDDG